MAEDIVEGIISVAMTVVFVIAGAYLVSTIFVPSGEDYSVMAMRDIASYSKKVDSASSNECYSFEFKVTPGFRINKIGDSILIETPDKLGDSALKKLELDSTLSLPDKYDGDDDLNNPGNSFPINEDFSETVNEEVCICKEGGKNILFPQPRILGIVETCMSVFR